MMFEEEELQPEFSVEDLTEGAPRCTDAANADAFDARHGAGYRYVVEWGKWISWNGQRWERVGADGRLANAVLLSAREDYLLCKANITKLEKQAHEASLKLDKDECERLDALIKFGKKRLLWHEQSQNWGRISSCISTLETRLPIALAELDSDPWLLNVANGTLDLRTAELLPHTREHYITQQTPVCWDDHAECPTWTKFLSTAMGGGTPLVMYLARTVGYSLTGLTTEQCLFFHYGHGSNGKSTFLDTIKRALGEYACSAPRDLLMVQKTPKHETEFARLLGKRIATGAEVGDGQRFDEAKVKDLTGGDVISCRRMHEDFWDLTPTHKLWLAGNYRPTITGADHGIWRRIRLIPWLVTIHEGAKDRDLPMKLRRELPGILRWAVNGCLEWQRLGLAEPETVQEATDGYKRESDVLGTFLAARCVFHPDGRSARVTLREAYERWCKDGGHEPVGGRRLAARLREFGVDDCSVRQGSQVLNGWKGVRMKTEAELWHESDPDSGAEFS